MLEFSKHAWIYFWTSTRNVNRNILSVLLTIHNPLLSGSLRPCRKCITRRYEMTLVCKEPLTNLKIYEWSLHSHMKRTLLSIVNAHADWDKYFDVPIFAWKGQCSRAHVPFPDLCELVELVMLVKLGIHLTPKLLTSFCNPGSCFLLLILQFQWALYQRSRDQGSKLYLFNWKVCKGRKLDMWCQGCQKVIPFCWTLHCEDPG
jgi:hypothetical protein